MRLEVFVRSAMASTRAPDRPWLTNSEIAARRMSSRVFSGLFLRLLRGVSSVGSSNSVVIVMGSRPSTDGADYGRDAKPKEDTRARRTVARATIRHSYRHQLRICCAPPLRLLAMAARRTATLAAP